MAMTRRQVRLVSLGLVVAGIAIAVTLSLYGLRENVSFFYSPADLVGDNARYDIPDRSFRLGGLVAANSVHNRDGRLYFTVTDQAETIRVVYDGLPPDLFREGQGVVASGVLQQRENGKIFVASSLLAKHDENYMPPEVHRALKRHGAQTPPENGQGADPP